MDSSFVQNNLDSCEISELTYQLGLFRYGQAQYREAIPYFTQSIEEDGKCPKERGLWRNLKFPQMYLNTLALCNEKINAPNNAVFYYQKTLGFLEGIAEEFPDESYLIEVAKGRVYGYLAYADIFRR